MEFLEKNLEDIIFETDNDSLNKRGLPIRGLKLRQVKIGNYGVCDLITIERRELNSGSKSLAITVYELKRSQVTQDALIQAVRYCRGVSRWIEYNKKYTWFESIKIRVVLIGKVSTSSDIVYIPDVTDFVSIYSYKYEFDGLRFEEISGYGLINEGF